MLLGIVVSGFWSFSIDEKVSCCTRKGVWFHEKEDQDMDICAHQRTFAHISVHLRTFAYICVHLRLDLGEFTFSGRFSTETAQSGKIPVV